MDLAALIHHVLVLDTHNVTAPVLSQVTVIVELCLEGGSKGLHILHVLLSHCSHGNASGRLHVAESTESGFTLGEAEWNSLLAAKSWQEDHSLNWVNIVGNHDELGLALLDESSHVVQTELKNDWLVSLLVFLLSLSLESVLLLVFGLWLVLGKELHQLGELVLVEGVLELGNSWWHLQTLEKNSLLSLEADVLGPLDEAGHVLSWLDVTTDSEVTGTLLEKASLVVLLSGALNDWFLSGFFDLSQ